MTSGPTGTGDPGLLGPQPQPGTPRGSRSFCAGAALAGLGASTAALLLAPTVSPAGYSWISRTISEAAAQGLPGAWLGRLGFLLFGLSVLAIADVCRRRWGAWGTGLHAGFGALMTATAAFSHRPWPAGQAFDHTEDLLHSVAATGMGFAFAAGVVVVALRPAGLPRRRVLDVVAVGASVALPIAMSAAPSADGLLQRVMFAVAYTWYAVEAVDARRPRSVPASADGGRPVTAGRRS